MGRKSDFDIAQSKIQLFLEKNDCLSMSQQVLYNEFDKMRHDWDISIHKTGKNFITFLTQNHLLQKKDFSTSEGRIKSLYVKPGIDDTTIFSGLKKQGYFTHYTALFLHQLTLQIPKTYYLNYEHYKSLKMEPPSQETVDRVFENEQRKSSQTFAHRGKTIIIINGKLTDRLGVISQNEPTSKYEYTDLERTLIDCTIRPAYAGGVFEVLTAFKNAKPKLDLNKLKDYLNKLDYLYPYEQCLGFYLEEAGYPEKVLQLFEKEFKLQFYLTYGMKRTQFSNRWNLHYPFGM